MATNLRRNSMLTPRGREEEAGEAVDDVVGDVAPIAMWVNNMLKSRRKH